MDIDAGSPAHSLWSKLGAVRSLCFEAVSGSSTGWSGAGSGEVVTSREDDVLLFREHGIWKQPQGRELTFSNVFRWSKQGDRIRLEHLRYGADRPVFLFDLMHEEGPRWREVRPHLCSEDVYTASLTLGDDAIYLAWSIQGPRKNESIEYTYR